MFFSLFREYDKWYNKIKNQSFFVINTGLVGKITVPYSADQILSNWLEKPRDNREFNHVLAIPYNFQNLLKIIRNKDRFDPTEFPNRIVPHGINNDFPDISSNQNLMKQHPTNAIRLIRCLIHDFKQPLNELIKNRTLDLK